VNEIVRREAEPTSAMTIPAELTVEQMVEQVKKIQHLMSSVMKEGEHYGVIPGTDKPSLLQPGAQKLNFVFRLGDQNTQITQVDMPNGHREYRVTLDIVHIPSGLVLSQGVGSCSTMETKYRYRNISDYEDTGLPIPADSKERKQEYRKQGFGMKKVNGVWLWVKYKDSTRVENPDIADTYNTVLKMANKRAYIHGTIKATAASDLFTQDVEDFSKEEEHAKESTAQPDPEPPELTDNEATMLLRSKQKEYGMALRNAVEASHITKDMRRSACRKWRKGRYGVSVLVERIQYLDGVSKAQEGTLKANSTKTKLGETVGAKAGEKATKPGELYDHD
jgi:hypothetical protein